MEQPCTDLRVNVCKLSVGCDRLCKLCVVRVQGVIVLSNFSQVATLTEILWNSTRRCILLYKEECGEQLSSRSRFVFNTQIGQTPLCILL